MFTTAQFRVFTTEPEERALAHPRNALRQGNRAGAEAAYLEILDGSPHLKAAWAEYFQLLRAEGRMDDALLLAHRAGEQFEDDAFALALRGAALIELGHLREALDVLQLAAERDPNFGMVWHEMGYAAFRLGQPGPALLALDRAFALDPRSGTLHLRGKILRNSGQYLAAEVAFSGAAESAEFPEQRTEAERQIGITRRYGTLARRPAELEPSRRWFGDTGAAVLTTESTGALPAEQDVVQALVRLVVDLEWRPTAVLATDDSAAWGALAATLGAPLVAHWPGPAARPLVVARRPQAGGEAWVAATARIGATGMGLSFVLEQPDGTMVADIAGRLSGLPSGTLDLPFAVQCAAHPEGRLAKRTLR